MKLLSVSGQTRDWLLAAVVVSFQARADAQTPRSNNVSTEEIAFAAAVGATFPEWGVTPLLDPSTDNDRWQGIAFAENTGMSRVSSGVGFLVNGSHEIGL